MNIEHPLLGDLRRGGNRSERFDASNPFNILAGLAQSLFRQIQLFSRTCDRILPSDRVAWKSGI